MTSSLAHKPRFCASARNRVIVVAMAFNASGDLQPETYDQDVASYRDSRRFVSLRVMTQQRPPDRPNAGRAQ